MRVPFAKQPGLRWLVTSLVLIGAMTVALGSISAEEAASNAKARTLGDARPQDTDALLRGVGVQSFQILEAVERHHIAAPPREKLLKIVAADRSQNFNMTGLRP